jgi:signal transduction histidine kinase
MTSIRSRIALAVVGCTAGAVAVAAVAVGVTTRAMLFRALDDRLHARVRFPWTVPRLAPGEHEATLPTTGGSSSNGTPGPTSPPGPTGATGPTGTTSPTGTTGNSAASWASNWPYAEIHDATDGAELWRAPSLPQGEALASHEVRPGDPIETVTLADGRPARLLVVSIDAAVRPPFRWRGDRSGERGSERGDRGIERSVERGGAGDPGGERSGRSHERDGDERTATERPSGPERKRVDLFLAIDASEIYEELRHLVWILVALWSGATALSWVVALWLRKTVLEPVDSLSRTIRKISPTHLAARVPAHEAPLELQPMVARLNELLARVETTFNRERATIANLAHELRNPLSALRAKLEFGLLQDPDLQHRALEAGVVVTRRMQSMINGLLTLTRIESGQEKPAVRSADVVVLLREAWRTVDPMARSRDMQAEWRVPASLELTTSPTHLALVLANLFDNAIAHGARGGTVEVEVGARDATVALVIANPYESTVRAGAAADGDEPREAFEPLWRRDPARSGDDHCGLGLALCDRVVRLLGGRIDVRQTETRFEVEIELPVAPARAAPPG